MTMNNDNRTAFITYPQIPGDKPMCDTEFWQWLDRQQPDSINRFIGTLKLWLAPYGFDITKHVLPVAQLERHRYVYEHFWWRYWDNQKR
jgi:hypothetical protein